MMFADIQFLIFCANLRHLREHLKVFVAHYLFCILLTLSLTLHNSIAQNLVPNPGFEEYTDCPSGLTEFYKVKSWSSPNKGTPDYFHECCDSLHAYGRAYHSPSAGIPKNQLGSQGAKNGKGYAGIIVMNQRPSFVEYIQTKLTQPLVAGKSYCVQMYVSLADYSRFSIDRLGFYFSNENIILKEWKPIEAVPQVANPENRLLNFYTKWMEVGGQYTANGGEQYLVIGNFEKPEHLKTEKTRIKEEQLPYGMSDILSYYYIDEVSVYPLDSNHTCMKKITPKAAGDTLLTLENIAAEQIKEGANIILKNIFFETAKSALLKESFPGLDKLVRLMNKFPSMKIEISGHTDNVDDDAYNLRLSEDRAKAVVKYLLGKGISYTRLSYKGDGESKPIADNSSEEGRKLNRRVEFKIISVE